MVRQVRVLLVTLVGPGGQMDVAARADVPIEELLGTVGGVIVPGARPLAATLAPGRGGERPRPLALHSGLSASGVVDGDTVVVRALGTDGDQSRDDRKSTGRYRRWSV
jgi:hypothetical protein